MAGLYWINTIDSSYHPHPQFIPVLWMTDIVVQQNIVAQQIEDGQLYTASHHLFSTYFTYLSFSSENIFIRSLPCDYHSGKELQFEVKE